MKKNKSLKYILIKNDTKEITIDSETTIAYRIQAIKEFNLQNGKCIPKGALGGYIESEKNLSQEGNCWLDASSSIIGNARVSGSSIVTLHSSIFGNAVVEGKCIVNDLCKIGGNAELKGEVQVYDRCWICDNSTIIGNVTINDYSLVIGNSYICGNNIVISEKSIIEGNAFIVANNICLTLADISNYLDLITFSLPVSNLRLASSSCDLYRASGTISIYRENRTKETYVWTICESVNDGKNPYVSSKYFKPIDLFSEDNLFSFFESSSFLEKNKGSFDSIMANSLLKNKKKFLNILKNNFKKKYMLDASNDKEIVDYIESPIVTLFIIFSINYLSFLFNLNLKKEDNLNKEQKKQIEKIKSTVEDALLFNLSTKKIEGFNNFIICNKTIIDHMYELALKHNNDEEEVKKRFKIASTDLFF